MWDSYGIKTFVVLGIDIKKGAPLSPNLLNLKSNTMKNTMQR